MQKITHTYLATLKPTDKPQQIPCGEGLVLRVSPKGKKSWYLRYDTLSAEGKRKQNVVSLGEFPALGLKEARIEADERKSHAKRKNTNIAKLRRAEKISQARKEKTPTFHEVAEDWLALKEHEWVAKSAKQNRGRLAANVYPVIGHVPIDQITVADVERALKCIIERGSLEVARRVHTLVVSVFKYALSIQAIENPDIVVRLTWYKESMPKRRKKSLYQEELAPEEIGQLLLTIHENRRRWTPPVSCALQVAPYCAVRPSELLEARWEEFDLDAAE